MKNNHLTLPFIITSLALTFSYTNQEAFAQLRGVGPVRRPASARPPSEPSLQNRICIDSIQTVLHPAELTQYSFPFATNHPQYRGVCSGSRNNEYPPLRLLLAWAQHNLRRSLTFAHTPPISNTSGITPECAQEIRRLFSPTSAGGIPGSCSHLLAENRIPGSMLARAHKYFIEITTPGQIPEERLSSIPFPPQPAGPGALPVVDQQPPSPAGEGAH